MFFSKMESLLKSLDVDWVPPVRVSDFQVLVCELQKSEALGVYWKEGWDLFFWKVGKTRKLTDQWMNELWVRPEVMKRTSLFRKKRMRRLRLAALSVQFIHPTEAELCEVGNLFYIRQLNLHCLSSSISLHAAEFGQVEILHYLWEQQVPMHPETSYWAAWGGHVTCLQFVVDKGIPWDKDTTKAAALTGHTDCILFAEAHGQTVHPQTYDWLNFCSQ